MEQKIDILNANGDKVGQCTAALEWYPEGLANRIGLRYLDGCLGFYLSQVLRRDIWPIFTVLDLLVYGPYRNQGHGTRACNEVADHYQELGARLGLIQIGGNTLQDDNFDPDQVWPRLENFYSRLGWVKLWHPSNEPATVPIMYLPLDGRKKTSSSATRAIVVTTEPSGRSIL